MGKRRAAQQEEQPDEAPVDKVGGSESNGHAGSDEENDYGLAGSSSSDRDGDGDGEGDGDGQQVDSEQGGGGGSSGTDEGEDAAGGADDEGDNGPQADANEGPGILSLAGGGDGSEPEEDTDVDPPLGDPGGRGASGAEPGSSDPDDEDGDSGSADSDGGSGGGGGKRSQGASFLAGDKATSFAKAFNKILLRPAKPPSGVAAAVAPGTTGARGAGAGVADMILAESTGVQQRRVEEEDDAAARHAAKKQRLEMKRRGLLPVPRKGEDPAHDAQEKALQRLATRGVVLLFNAVNAAQRQRAEAEAAGGVARRKAAVAKLGKASFLAELRQAAGAGVPAPAAAAAAGAGAGRATAAGGSGGAGWDVLGQGFPGLTGGSKMRDWDKRAGSDDEAPGEQPHLKDADVSSDEGDGW